MRLFREQMLPVYSRLFKIKQGGSIQAPSYPLSLTLLPLPPPSSLCLNPNTPPPPAPQPLPIQPVSTSSTACFYMNSLALLLILSSTPPFSFYIILLLNLIQLLASILFLFSLRSHFSLLSLSECFLPFFHLPFSFLPPPSRPCFLVSVFVAVNFRHNIHHFCLISLRFLHILSLTIFLRRYAIMLNVSQINIKKNPFRCKGYFQHFSYKVFVQFFHSDLCPSLFPIFLYIFLFPLLLFTPSSSLHPFLLFSLH